MHRSFTTWLFGLSFILVLTPYSNLHAQVLINELCTQNAGIEIPGAPSICDWVELVNISNEEVNLSGFFFSDELNDPFKAQLISDDDLNLAPDAFMVLYPNGTNNCPTCLPFKLSSSGESLYIHSADSVLVDSLTFPQLVTDVSWGRSNDQYLYYMSPTPLSPNNEEGFAGIVQPCDYSEESQLADTPLQITLSHPNADAVIHYSVDGSLPNSSYPSYSAPLEIDSTTILRTRVYREGYIPSPVTGIDILFHSSGLDIMSISADPTDLFGISGIYDNYTLDEEVAAYFTYMDQSLIESFSSPSGLELHSPDSEDQKSLRLSAKNQFGASAFDFPFFPQRSDDSFETLILRNAGEDGLEFDGSGIRDLLIHQRVAELDPGGGYSAGHPVEVFLNGAYWGIYNLRERQDPHYIDQHFTEAPVHFLERTSQYPSTRFAIEGEWEDYDLLEQTIVELDLSAEENLQFISNWMNLEDFTDHQLTEIFICNQDWLSNNMKFWRPQDETAPWKWLLWDTDWGLGTWYPDYPSGYASWNALNFALSDWGGWTEEVETELLQKLVENESFRNAISSRAADLRNHYFHEDKWLEDLGQLEVAIGAQSSAHFDRWPGDSLSWAEDVQVVRDFLLERGDHFLVHFRDQFELEAIHQVTIDCVPENSALLEVNTISPGAMPWTGDYFQTIPVNLFPHALPGFQFSHWEDAPSDSNEREIDLDSDTTLIAHFEPYTNSSDPIINELMFDPAPGSEEMEWIELTHVGEDTLFLHGYTISDGNESYVFSSEAVIPPGSFVIVCEDPELFSAQHPEIAHVYGPLPFRLSNEGETIWIEDYTEETVDEVSYQLLPPWPIGASDTDKSLELITLDLDNNDGGNWFVDLNPGGSPGAANLPDVHVQENDFNLSFVVSPNPSSGSLRIQMPKNVRAVHRMEVIDTAGQLVWQRLFSSGGAQNLFQCELPEQIRPGIYTLRLINTVTGKSATQILILQ